MPRKALVIGIGSYDHATQLSTPAHDAEIVAGALTDLGFQIAQNHLLKGRIDRSPLLAAVRQFSESLSEGDIAFIYFSGHGLERQGTNYLVPSNGQANADSPGHSYVPLDHLLGLIEDANVAAAIILLDACRVDPFSGTGTEDRDLLDISPQANATPPMEAPTSVAPPAPTTATSSAGLVQVDTGPTAVLLAYAAQPRRPAFSLRRGEEPNLGSIYTRVVAHRLRHTNGYPIKDILSLAEVDVFELTGEKQKPFQNPFGLLYLMLAPNPYFQAMEEDIWARTAAPAPPAEQIKSLKEFLRMFPGSEHSHAARKKLAELTSIGSFEALAIAAADNRQFADDISVFGGLQSISRSSDGAVMAGANRNLVIRDNWNTVFKSRTVGTISTGEVVKVVGVHPGGNAVQVVTEAGEVGYVGNLDLVSAGVGERTARLAFSSSGPFAEAVDWAPLRELGDMLSAGNVAVKIRIAKENSRGVSDQIGHLRALRLRDAVIAQGVSPDRVLIEPPDDSLPSQTAEIVAAEVAR